jgi:hypothetical protein
MDSGLTETLVAGEREHVGDAYAVSRETLLTREAKVGTVAVAGGEDQFEDAAGRGRLDDCVDGLGGANRGAAESRIMGGLLSGASSRFFPATERTINRDAEARNGF